VRYRDFFEEFVKDKEYSFGDWNLEDMAVNSLIWKPLRLLAMWKIIFFFPGTLLAIFESIFKRLINFS
jgi:hypothetical protein